MWLFFFINVENVIFPSCEKEKSVGETLAEKIGSLLPVEEDRKSVPLCACLLRSFSVKLSSTPLQNSILHTSETYV